MKNVPTTYSLQQSSKLCILYYKNQINKSLQLRQIFTIMSEDLVLLCSQCNKNVKEVQNDEFYESWSSIQIQVVKLRHSLTISNFSLCCQDKGEKLVSSTFSAGSNNEKLEWCLWIYPKGSSSKENSGDVSLFLYLVKGNKDGSQTKFKCGIVNAKDENVNVLNGSNLFKPGRGSGWDNFISQKCLFDEENEYLVNDKLTIFCEIIAGVASRNIFGTLSTPQGDLGFDFTFLHENKHLNDIILSTDGKEIPAHKAILSARSPVFRAMFQHDMEESRNNRVEITDVDGETLGEMLRYMYTGKINKLDEMAPRLLAIAEKYELDDLKIICEKALLKILSIENVVEIFILSDKFAATELKNQVKEFIAAHRAVLVNTPKFKSIFRMHPDLGLEVFYALNENSSSF